MSDELSDAEGEILFKRLNRRTQLVSSLTRNPARYWSVFHFLSLAAVAVLALAARSSALDPTLLMSIAGILLLATGLSFALVNKRIDTLIEILREDGLLDSLRPVDRAAHRAK